MRGEIVVSVDVTPEQMRKLEAFGLTDEWSSNTELSRMLAEEFYAQLPLMIDARLIHG
jgi:hypothetical protein